MKIKKFLKSLSDTRIFFFATLWLMVLLVVGTIVQKDIGIYQAQVKYFSSIILWFGIIPLPGGAITMAVIFFGLFSKLVYRTSYSKRNIGIAITIGYCNHTGIITNSYTNIIPKENVFAKLD